MQSALRGARRPRSALTDVYSSEQRLLLVRYPPLLVVALGIGGLLAFALTGFLGYADEPAAVVAFFHQPWPLFLWLSALLLTLEASIFRHPALRLRLFAILTVTVVSMTILAIFYFYRSEMLALVAQLLEQPRQVLALGLTLDGVLGNPWTYTLLDGLILAIFWVDTIRRWLRRASGLALNPRAELTGASSTSRALPRMEDLFSGDMMAGAVLLFLLALVFQPVVIGFIAQLAQSHATISQCTVSLPGTCANTLTLTFLNLVGGLVALSLGLLILAFSATLSGLGAVGAVDESEVEEPALLALDESSTESVSEQVSLTVVHTLRTALDRRVRLAVSNLAFSLRAVVWPLLVFVATVGLALASRAIQSYLHSDKSPTAVVFDLLPAIAWGVVALVAALVALGLLSFSARVVGNTLRFLGLAGFVLLLTFWIFSLALWGTNELLMRAGLTLHTPFIQLGATTILSAIALVSYGVLAVRAAAAGDAEPAQANRSAG